MTVFRHSRWALAFLLVLGACAAEDPPSEWEIVQGTAILTASKAVNSVSGATIVDYDRTGTITIHPDSTISGQIALAPGQTANFTGLLTGSGSSLLVQLTDLNPGSYSVLTSGKYPDTYALVSTAEITSDVTGDGIAEKHRVYWQFQK